MWAHVEYFDGGIIRVFQDDSQFLVDPYLYSMTFKVLDDEPQTIELVGVTRAPTFSQLRTIVTELRSRGIRVIRIRRCGANPGKKEFR